MQRSRFLISASALAAAAFLREVALAPAAPAPQAQIEALISTVVPFGAGFPLAEPSQVVQRMETLFHLRENAAFQASLAAFASVGAFTAPPAELFELERSADERAVPEQLLEHDRRAFRDSGLAKTQSFAEFTPEERARYVRLWTQSAFSIRRRFYMSIRAVTFEAFYSMPQVWEAIGYAGPILHKGVSHDAP